MQPDLISLIQRLCVIAGTIMEDASVDAVSLISSDPAERARRLDQLARAASDIAVLAAAAAALNRRFSPNFSEQ